jgi:hypothetical protein
MIRLARHSERFQASGGISARGTHRALGAHGLDFWKLFLRETIQNSWDARIAAEGPISFGVHAWQASPDQRHLLRDVILEDPPSQLGFPEIFGGGPLDLLVVADSGTWGLGGPTRADIDVTSAPGGRTDFVDLVRDSGRRATKGFAGGTYGFGKVVLCEASAVSTVVIYSRTIVGGAQESRFIAMAIGSDEYQEVGARYTGRHWWGIVDDVDDVAEPATSRDAEAAAAALGLGDLIDGPSGTAIMVIAPRTPDDSGLADLGEITTAINQAAIEYAWPHLFAEPPSPTIKLSVTLNGTSVRPHDLAHDERLKMFVEAYNKCRHLQSGRVEEEDEWPWSLRQVKSERPLCELGALAWRHYGSFLPSGQSAEVRAEVALIRSPRFVVSYMGLPTHPSGQSTLGVFLADPNLDEGFARSEPPTHDSWNPTKGREFNPARQVLKKIPDLVKPRPASSVSRRGRDDPGVVAVASALGGLLDGQQVWGDVRIPMAVEGFRPPVPTVRAPPAQPWIVPNDTPGTSDSGSAPNPSAADPVASRATHTGTPDRHEPAGGGGVTDRGTSAHGGGPRLLRRPTVQPDGQFRLLIAQGFAAAEFSFTVQKPTGYGVVEIAARPIVFIDGGRETEAPLAAAIPEILEWRDQVTGIVAYGSCLVITQDGESRWSVVVSQPDDAAVTVTLSVEPR